MIFIYCLPTHVVLWHSGKSACLVNRRSLVENRAVPHFQIILCFIIMFTLFVSPKLIFTHCLTLKVALWLSG